MDSKNVVKYTAVYLTTFSTVHDSRPRFQTDVIIMILCGIQASYLKMKHLVKIFLLLIILNMIIV